MKSILQNSYQYFLAHLAKIVVAVKQPRIVGITGSVGKTGTKDTITAVLAQKYNLRSSYGNLNNEVGLPLTVLGIQDAGHPLIAGFKALTYFLTQLLAKNYPEILVLEYAADRPGDIEYLTWIARPQVAVITRVGTAHMEFFTDVEALQKEKSGLVRVLDSSGLAVLNADDPRVAGMKRVIKGSTISYGIEEKADFKAAEIMLMQESDTHLKDPSKVIGLSALISFQNQNYKIKLQGKVGLPAVYESLSAIAVGSSLGLAWEDIAKGLSRSKKPKGRLTLLSGIKDSVLLDDSYNSSPEAAQEALKVLKQIKARRRVAVLGDMLELGQETEKLHRRIGKLVYDLGVDVLFVVGARAKFIAQQALEEGFPKTRIFEFDDSFDAGLELQKLMITGDVVLIKGSQGVRLERVVKEVMADPERAGELLCRQSRKWLYS